MGIPLFKTSHLTTENGRLVALPNPNPENFRIKRLAQVGSFLGALIVYPDATNFEGNKILVFAGVTADELRQRATIDPHFKEEGDIIARFRPDEQGWEDTMAFLKLKGQQPH